LVKGESGFQPAPLKISDNQPITVKCKYMGVPLWGTLIFLHAHIVIVQVNTPHGFNGIITFLASNFRERSVKLPVTCRIIGGETNSEINSDKMKPTN